MLSSFENVLNTHLQRQPDHKTDISLIVLLLFNCSSEELELSLLEYSVLSEAKLIHFVRLCAAEGRCRRSPYPPLIFLHRDATRTTAIYSTALLSFSFPTDETIPSEMSARARAARARALSFTLGVS